MTEGIIGSNPNSESNEEFGSTDNFFDALENEVNSAITDANQQQEVTPQQNQDPVQATPETKQEDPKEDVDWEKRYKDSSREAQRLNTEVQETRPYKPILDAMKNDRGLVDHVRNYLQGNVEQKTPEQELNLPEDFVFDPHEAMTDTESNSAKLFRNFLDKQVNTKIARAQDIERRRAMQAQTQTQKAIEADEFKKKHNMSDEDFEDMMGKAKGHKMTLDDIHYLINRDKANANIANNAKQDMLNQMKNVRDIPTSSAGVNSAKVEQKYEDEIFEALKGSDGDIDNIFNG